MGKQFYDEKPKISTQARQGRSAARCDSRGWGSLGAYRWVLDNAPQVAWDANKGVLANGQTVLR